jgi:hypothetical protein
VPVEKRQEKYSQTKLLSNNSKKMKKIINRYGTKIQSCATRIEEGSKTMLELEGALATF